MDWITGRKSAQLLAGLLTFFVTALAVAGGSSVNSSVNSSVINSKISAFQQMVKSQKTSSNGRTLKDSKSMGGPGMDGGGGVGVLMRSGRVRFLDMAAYEKRELVPFDDQAYTRILLKNGRYVPAAGELVKSSEFFSCSDKILSAQTNPLLQYLVSKNLKIEIVKTSLPLEIPRGGSITTAYLSNTGWVNEMPSLPAEILKSPSYPSEFQRPIASYVAQGVGRAGGGLFEQTLIISSQLYDLLTERDKCALQVHEIFRYIGNFGHIGRGDQNSPLRLLTRPLTTLEIETLTQRVMAGDPVLLSEIPAMDSYKIFSVATLEELSQMSPEQFEDIRTRLLQMGVLSTTDTKEIDESIGGTMLLFHMWDNANKSTSLAEEAIMEIKSRTVRANQRRLKNQQIDLRSLLD